MAIKETPMKSLSDFRNMMMNAAGLMRRGMEKSVIVLIGFIYQ